MSVVSDEVSHNKYEIKNHSLKCESSNSISISINDSRLESACNNIGVKQSNYNIPDNLTVNYLDTNLNYNKNIKKEPISNIEPMKNTCIFSVKEVDPDLLLEELIKFEEIKDSFKSKS